jgi:hypothetical protein
MEHKIATCFSLLRLVLERNILLFFLLYWGTLLNLQKFLPYIIVEFIPSIVLLYLEGNILAIVKRFVGLGGMAYAVEYLPSKHEALSPTLSIGTMVFLKSFEAEVVFPKCLFIFFFWWYRGLNSTPLVYQAGDLPFEPHPSLFAFSSFFFWIGAHIFA